MVFTRRLPLLMQQDPPAGVIKTESRYPRETARQSIGLVDRGLKGRMNALAAGQIQRQADRRSVVQGGFVGHVVDVGADDRSRSRDVSLALLSLVDTVGIRRHGLIRASCVRQRGTVIPWTL